MNSWLLLFLCVRLIVEAAALLSSPYPESVFRGSYFPGAQGWDFLNSPAPPTEQWTSALYYCQVLAPSRFPDCAWWRWLSASVPSSSALFPCLESMMERFPASFPVVDSCCLLLSTRPTVGLGEVACPSFRCSSCNYPFPSSRHLLHLLFPKR